MKKLLFSLYVAIILLLGITSLQAGEFFAEGLTKGVVVEKGVAEGGEVAFNKSLTESFGSVGTLLDDAAKGLKGDALEAFQKAAAEAGELVSAKIGGEVGSLSVDISDKTLAEALDKLNAIEGVKIDPAAFKLAAGKVDSEALNSSIPKAVEDKSIPVSEEAEAAANAELAAKKDVSSFRLESNKLDNLTATKAALEKEGADTTAIDAEIQTQRALVDSYGYGSITGPIAKKLGVFVDALTSLKNFIKSAFSDSRVALKGAQAEVNAVEKTLSSATKKLEGAQNELKVTTDNLEAASVSLTEKTDLYVKKPTPELKAEIDALNSKIETFTKDIATNKQAIADATTEIDAAIKDYAGKSNVLKQQEADLFKKANSTASIAWKKAKADVDLMKAQGVDVGSPELAEAVDVRDRLYNVAKQEGSFTEKAKLNAKEKVTNYIKTAGQTFVAGVIFMIPGFILGAFNDEKTRTALLETIGRPQKFGDIYMQIPQELINKENPLASVFLYVGFPGGDCKAGTFEDGSCRMNEAKIDATRDFYVSEGASSFEGWATQPITSTSFSGNMIHLNTGYTFGANGQPTEDLFPSKQLLNTAAQENEAKYSTPASIADFLDNFAQVLSGSITVEEFNPALFWDETQSSEVVGGEDEKTDAKKKSDTTMESDDLAAIMSWYDDKGVEKSCTIGAKDIKPCPQILQESLVGTIAAPMAWGDSGVNNVWPMTILSDAEITEITGTPQSLGENATEDAALPAYGIYLYKTTFTDLGKKLNDISQGDAATGIEGLVADYVFALDADLNIVPMRVPMVETGGSYGPTFKFTINPAVVKIYSVLTGQATILDSGITQKMDLDTGQEAYKKLSSRAIGQVLAIKSWYPNALKYGPFTIGTKVLTIDKSLADAGTFVYAIDPAQQPAGVSGTLEDGGIDYVVALDANKNIIDVGSAASGPNEFLSLVTSRFYDTNLKPYNSENGKEDTDFIVVNCNGSYKVETGTDARDCDTVSLAGKAGPFKAPLYTLFMDADLNPYNKPSLMSFTAELGKQVGTQVSTLIESAFVAAGVTEQMMQKLSSDQRTALIDLIIAVLPTIAGDDWTIFQTALADYQNKIAAWQDAGKAKSGTEYDEVVAAQAAYISSADAIVAGLQTNGTALGVLGTNLTDSSIDSALITALDDVKNQLATAAPRAVIIPSTQKQYVDAGLIPVPDQWAMGLSGLISSAMKTAVQDLVNVSYSAWKDFLVSTKDQWSLYLDKGPFSISPDGTLIPVTIEATSVDDLALGVYIYTSDSLPGEFLVVGSGTSDALLGQKFEVLSKAATPYLLSLSTGKMYDVSSGDLEVVADYTPKTPEQVRSFIQSKFPNAADDLIKAIIDSQSAVVAMRSAAEFSNSFYRFALLLDNQDADAGVFIYQDITPIADAQTMDRATLLAQVKDFFVYAELQPDGSTYSWGLEMPKVLSDDSRLISLITGIIYDKNGPVGLFENFQEPGVASGAAQAGAFNKIWTIIENKAQIKGSKIRVALADAVSAQLQKPIAQAQEALAQYTQATKDENLANKGYKLLTVSDVTAINSIAPSDEEPNAIFCSATNTDNCMVSGAYPNLKKYKGKYYQVYQSFLSDVAQTVADFAVSGGPDDVAILYDITYASDGTTVQDVAVNTVLTGEIRDQARAAAGVIVSGSQQTLGIPNEQPGIDSSLLKPLSGFVSQTLSFGTVDFYSYKRNPIIYITPLSGSPYYLDLASGIMFDKNGKPISIGGKYAKNSVDNRYLLASRISDGSITSIMYEGTNGIALEYVVKDIENNPSAPVKDATGNYNTKTYIMQARWDSTNNLKIIEYSPIKSGTRYYEVIEQSAVTYDESNNELLYFQNEPQTFTDVGNFREIQYAVGKPADEIDNPSNAYVLESADGQDEAIFWQDTQLETTGIIDYVVYKKSGTNFVANYSWENDGASGDGVATISFTDNLTDSAASAAYGITIYYSELTDVDNNITYKFVDKLNILQEDVMNNFLALLGVTVATDYKGNSILARNLSAVQTMNASTLAGNVYPASDLAKLADQFRLVTVLKSAGPTEAETKYLYKIGSSKVASYPDSGFAFNSTVGDGNYIDIETGIAYSGSTNKAIGSIKLTELLLLRDAVIHTSAQLIPQCQIDGNCTATQTGPYKKVLSYMA